VQRPQRGQIGFGHIAFQVGSYAALRDAYAHLVGNGVEILRAPNHIVQRSFYFTDPDGNTLEIYYELLNALGLFPRGPCRPGLGAKGQQTRRAATRLVIRGLAGARDEGEDREPAPCLCLSTHWERDDSRCWSMLHAPPPATKR
jgi:Glyoxalase/Bleomycin resistance protein/Dioxygenase superfamily